MRTIRLTIEYDGTAYVGWQRQAKGRSIQQLLEEALGQIVREKVVLHSSGRTDAGVHARAMIAHFRTESPFPLVAFREGVNRFLPDDIAVREAVEETRDFHARFSAGGKWYRYRIFTAPVRSPAFTRTAWHIRQDLDFATMAAAARFFVGRHDFAAFRTTSCDARTTIREIYSLDLQRDGEIITIDVHGSGFLRHMVRIIVGTLVEIGLHKRPAEDIPRLLAREPGLRAGVNAPPQGLCLMEVYYPEAELIQESGLL
ncbi:MAG: tRNA pseudouridine(38-40) synthase TruA [Deltaproteobacteria bacterium HGW-Deltaproteobacteria-4]|nr:MAG: tRNA pseudouridine(38-40) synthase TruA [Deltaproteobacteria bacterium HGW-Deltaproteobacteria-4]